MRASWSKIPMLRVAIALISGIGLAMMFNQEQLRLVWIWIFAAIMVCSLVSVIIFNHLKNISLAYRFKAWGGVVLTLAIFATGYLLAVFHIQKYYTSDFSHFLSQQNQLVAQIDEPPVLRDKIVMANAEVKDIKSGEKIIRSSGRIQLDIIKDSLSEHLHYGDVILIQSKIDPVEGPENPDEFNYKRYLAFQNIYYKAFLNPGSWKRLKQRQGNILLAFIFRMRDNLLVVIKKYVTDKNDFGVASAIMLGYRDYINGDIMRAYASSGTIHVLSVSGLHVGIIFIMLNFLLQWMDARGRKAEITKAVIIITFIWFYACLTGMSPPVLRSAIMFSLIQLGKVLIRNVNMFNIVAGSAILLLLYDPFVLADVGFQLSYMAVFGIIYLQPKIYTLFTINVPERTSSKVANFGRKIMVFFKHDLKWLGLWLMDWCWQLIAVSLAAQLATLPLILLYFYQFPNLFLISNLIVIPMSNFVLFSGTALFVFSHIPVLNDIMGWIFSHLLMLLDKYIFWTDGMPLAVTHDLSINNYEMILLYAIIILLCWFGVEKKPKLIIASLVLFLGLCSFHSYRTFNNHERKQIVVYDVPKEKAIAFISGNKVLCDFDTALWNNSAEMAFSIRHHWANCRITDEIPLASQPQNAWLPGFGKLVLFEGKKVLLIDSATENKYKNESPLKLDLVIISGNPKIHISQLKKLFDFRQVVFDSSNKTNSIRRWETECDGSAIQYWDTRVQGAYIETIN